MYNHFYLKRSHFNLMLFIFILFSILDFYPLVLLLFYLVILFFFKVRDVDQVVNTDTGNKIFAPVAGVCSNIKNTDKETIITIRTNFFEDYGIRMPINGKVFSGDKDTLTLESYNQSKIKLKFRPIFNKLLRSWSSEGDICQLGALLGIMPFGGKINITLNNDEYMTMIKRGEKLFFSESTIAIIKERT